MKSSWNLVKLGEVLKQDKEYVDTLEPIEYKKLSVKLYGKGVVLDDSVNGATVRMTKHQFAKAGQVILSEIWAKKGAIGIVPDEGEGALCTSHFFLFDYIKEKIYPPFFNLFIIGNLFETQLSAKAQGTTGYAATRPKDFFNLEIPLPSMPEQHRIAGRLEALKGKMDAVRALRGEQEKEMKGLLLAQYRNIIEGAEWKPMKEVAPLVRRKVDLQPSTIYSEIAVRSFGKGVFEKPNFNSDELTWEKPNWIKGGDLLMSNIKAWEGAVASVGKEHDGKVGSHRYLTFVPNLEITSAEFLAFYFLTDEGLLKLGEASPGSADRNRTLNTKIILNTLVPVPDIHLQNAFLQLQAKMEQLKAAQGGQLVGLEGVFPAVLERAFQGSYE